MCKLDEWEMQAAKLIVNSSSQFCEIDICAFNILHFHFICETLNTKFVDFMYIQCDLPIIIILEMLQEVL
jgi:hypothetical protein